MDVGHWGRIVDFIKRSERVYELFIDIVKFWRVNHDHQLIQFKTMTSSDKETINQNTNCNHFWDFAFGINVHFIVHADDNATCSIAYVHQSDHPYKLIKNTIAYVSFPCLVMAGALRSEDVLIFNTR